MNYDIKCRDGICKYKEPSILEKIKLNCGDDIICQTEIELLSSQINR